MIERWYYARDGQRQGPVPKERLVDLAREGWLSPDDLVWTEGMSEWQPARSFDWLVGRPITRTVSELVDATLHPEKQSRGPSPHPLRERPPLVDWENLAPRHLLATAGAFLAALGIAFTAIAHSRLALGLTLGGLFLAALGMHVECVRLLSQVKENLDKHAAERAARRLEEERLALERRRLDLEVERLAAERAAATQTPGTAEASPPAAPPPVEAPRSSAAAAHNSADSERDDEPPVDDRIVIYHLPVRRFSPGVAAILSLFVPGLGQLYKGQFFRAIVWFVIVLAGYLALVLPGVVLHACCILGALSGNPWTDPMTTYQPRPAHWPAGKQARGKRRPRNRRGDLSG